MARRHGSQFMGAVCAGVARVGVVLVVIATVVSDSGVRVKREGGGMGDERREREAEVLENGA